MSRSQSPELKQLESTDDDVIDSSLVGYFKEVLGSKVGDGPINLPCPIPEKIGEDEQLEHSDEYENEDGRYNDVMEEKLSDRITALHQLVAPFGKNDTACVLFEAIGYIKFLQNQIKGLSMPCCLDSGAGNRNIRQLHQQQSDQVERNCLIREDLGETCNEETDKDLRSRGLCLVPVVHAASRERQLTRILRSAAGFGRPGVPVDV